MDKILKLGLAISLLFLSFLIKAQEKGEVTYFLVEDLSSENYSFWYNSLTEEDKTSVFYTCVPAKIIGVKESFTEKFISTTELWKSAIKKLKITSNEVELKCAEQRKL
jgi:hypothetical protein